VLSMETDGAAVDLGAEIESAHTTDRKSARNQRIELITRGERRRRWSVEQKREIAAESLEPGLSPITVATASVVACSIRGGEICWKGRLGSPVSRWRSSRVLR
jgi:hypothetical protein